MIKTIALIGSGNVATHLGTSLQKAGYSITGVYSPTLLHARELAGKLNTVPLTALEQTDTTSDLILIAVPDRFTKEVSEALPKVQGIVAHTSGITPLSALNRHPNHGVFYPLQTFSAQRKIDLPEVPFCIEANTPAVENELMELAKSVSRNVNIINTRQRIQLHLAAVFVNNFVNYLYTVSSELLEKENLDFKFLQPLIEETTRKIKEIAPEAAQTGPARRNDTTTIEQHLKLLKDFPQYRQLYELFSNQIKKKYHHE